MALTQLARIMRIEEAQLVDLDRKLRAVTGKEGVMEAIIEENNLILHRTINELGLSNEDATAEKVYELLEARLAHMDKDLFNFLEMPNLAELSNRCGKLCETAIMIHNPGSGFFLKHEKAKELLFRYPPEDMLKHFGYKSVKELLENHNMISVFSALRFMESQEWMHHFFESSFADISADDFEERPVELKVLETEWLGAAQKFLTRKYHNVSHLKELGVIFIIPLDIDMVGETLRVFSLVLHYLNEVPFYSELFRKFSKEADFSDKIQSLLRGDVSGKLLPDSGRISFRIVQRYLAKENASDFRLFEPHINPEAEHWYNTEKDFSKLSSIIGEKGHVFGFFRGLDTVGNFFKNKNGEDVLLSFDLIDVIMSILNKKLEAPLIYHQQESLWNKIFLKYFGKDKLHQVLSENIISGVFTI